MAAISVVVFSAVKNISVYRFHNISESQVREGFGQKNFMQHADNKTDTPTRMICHLIASNTSSEHDSQVVCVWS